MVIRLFTGKFSPEFRIAALSRSRDSLTAASGSPTMFSRGIPRDRSHSTRMISVSTPTMVQLLMNDTMFTNPFIVSIIS